MCNTSSDTWFIDAGAFFSEGRAAANTYQSKHAEVSTTIDHKIDELLVGILKQIRLTPERQRAKGPERKDSRADAVERCCFQKARSKVLAKLFHRDTVKSRWKSCDDLYAV